MRSCLPGVVTHVPASGAGSAASVWVAQAQGDPGEWEIDLSALLDGASFFVARAVLPATPSTGGGRVVLVETVPGAGAWSAIVRGPAAAARSLGVQVSASDVGTESSIARAALFNPAGGYAHDVGSSGGTTLVPAGAQVTHVAAVDDGTGTGTITIGTQGAIPLLANQPFELPRGACEGLSGPVAVVFANVAQRFVSWRV